MQDIWGRYGTISSTLGLRQLGAAEERSVTKIITTGVAPSCKLRVTSFNCLCNCKTKTITAHIPNSDLVPQYSSEGTDRICEKIVCKTSLNLKSNNQD